MVLPRGNGDYTRKYRPLTFDNVVGQEMVVAGLRNRVIKGDGIRCFLLYGESGTGKTTLAKIFSMAVNCQNPNNGSPCCECESCLAILNNVSNDVLEINASEARGIDDIRELKNNISSLSIFGAKKVFILDEGHGMTSQAQEALLKVIDSLTENSFIFICSTDPNKIIKTVRNRCEQYKFDLLTDNKIRFLLDTVCLFESLTLDKDILKAIIESASGRPRNALVSLQQAVNIGFDNKEAIIKTISGFLETENIEIMELCKALTFNKANWSSIMELYKNINTDVEQIRITMAGWFRSILERSTEQYMATKAANALSKLVNPFPTPKPENSLVLTLFYIYQIYK